MRQGVAAFLDETYKTFFGRGNRDIAHLSKVLGEGIFQPGTVNETNKYPVWFNSWHKLSRYHKLVHGEINFEKPGYAVLSARMNGSYNRLESMGVSFGFT